MFRLSTCADRARVLHLLLCVAALFPSPNLHAADPRPVGSLIGACQACHGTQGISADARIPNLAGQKADYLAKQLEAFRSGERKSDPMAAMARQLGDAEIRALAQFWSQLPPSATAADPAVAPIQSRMDFPSGFPNGFTLYGSQAGEGGRDVARRYANAIALNAARAGQPLPAGSVIVTSNHATADDPARSYSAMELRAGWGAEVPELLRNGDWDYALFGTDRIRRDSVNIAPCLACHQPIAADSHVFTLKSLRAAPAREASGTAPAR